MTPLRLRMIEDMTLAGLAAGTQAIYIQAVRRLAAHYRRSPDQLSEDEVRAYLLVLRERGVALGTFKTHHGGIQFLYRRTLERDWPLFWLRLRCSCFRLCSGPASCSLLPLAMRAAIVMRLRSRGASS